MNLKSERGATFIKVVSTLVVTIAVVIGLYYFLIGNNGVFRGKIDEQLKIYLQKDLETKLVDTVTHDCVIKNDFNDFCKHYNVVGCEVKSYQYGKETNTKRLDVVCIVKYYTQLFKVEINVDSDKKYTVKVDERVSEVPDSYKLIMAEINDPDNVKTIAAGIENDKAVVTKTYNKVVYDEIQVSEELDNVTRQYTSVKVVNPTK